MISTHNIPFLPFQGPGLKILGHSFCYYKQCHSKQFFLLQRSLNKSEDVRSIIIYIQFMTSLHTSSKLHNSSMSGQQWPFYTAVLCKSSCLCILQRVAEIVDFFKYLVFLEIYCLKTAMPLKGWLFHRQLCALWDGSTPLSITNLGTYTS